MRFTLWSLALLLVAAVGCSSPREDVPVDDPTGTPCLTDADCGGFLTCYSLGQKETACQDGEISRRVCSTDCVADIDCLDGYSCVRSCGEAFCAPAE